MHTTSHITSRVPLAAPVRQAALLLVLLLTVAGCGGDDAGATASSGETTNQTATTEQAATQQAATEQAATEQAATEQATTEAGNGDVVAITAVDYAYEGLPATVPSGTELTLQGAPDAEPHELVAFRLDDGDDRSIEELLATDGPPPGTFAGVLIAPPGGAPGIAPEGPLVLDDAGRYLFLCFIPTGTTADAFAEVVQSGGTSEDLPEVGPPHFVQGMIADLTVS